MILTARKFRWLREHLGYSQAKMAEKLARTERTIQRYEGDEAVIPGAIREKLWQLVRDQRAAFDEIEGEFAIASMSSFHDMTCP